MELPKLLWSLEKESRKPCSNGLTSFKSGVCYNSEEFVVYWNQK